MSSIFKVLASITALLLFIGGCAGLVSRCIVWFRDTGFTGTGADMADLALQFVFIAVWLLAAVVAMRLRQKM